MKRTKAKKKKPDKPYWDTKTLKEMTPTEWESLCDGCAKCCLNKFEDEDTLKIYYSDVACKLLDLDSCRCSNYPERKEFVEDCIRLTPKMLEEMTCLPPTCAYRLLHEGKKLYSWHPLNSGDSESIHKAKMSVRGRAVSELDIPEADIEDRLVKWPSKRPSRNKRF